MHKVARRTWLTGVVGAAAASALGGCSKGGGKNQILNASYDPTRELYAEYNTAFAKYWKGKGNPDPTIKQAHGGSGKQARAVIDGLEADVVTLALGYDIDEIAARGFIAKDWQSKFANKSSPYTSTIVFLVRKGNPKGIKDWGDLGKDGIEIITPNPKTSGGARWNYLAAWGYQLRQNGGDAAKAEEFVRGIYRKVPVLDSGARGSTTTFVERKIGDVLLAWENEALLAAEKLGAGEVEIVMPSTSILAEPPVAVVDKVVERRGSRELATAYLEYLYSDDGQAIASKHYYRPRSQSAPSGAFAKIDLFSIDEVFSGWETAHASHFADGATFDKIYQPT